MRLSPIEAVLPEAHVIHLIGDGRDVALSSAVFTTAYHEGTKIHEEHEAFRSTSFVLLRVLRVFVMSRRD